MFVQALSSRGRIVTRDMPRIPDYVELQQASYYLKSTSGIEHTCCLKWTSGSEKCIATKKNKKKCTYIKNNNKKYTDINKTNVKKKKV